MSTLMILFSVDGMDIILLFYMTENNYSVFCNQKQGSTKNVNAKSDNLYGATYIFFLTRFAHNIINQAQAQIHTSHSTPMLTSPGF